MENRITSFGSPLRLCSLLASVAILASSTGTARASTAYGSLNNFDCVNDTGVEAHGFDIELEDIHSKDITYTYDYNHYGAPKITEDNSDPLHPKVLVRYVSARNANGTWAAYTAIPAGPIAPTQGHQFTNPAVNFGGEHFGVGYYGTPSAVRYNWLIDDGNGNLIRGPAVNVSTPTFIYNPPVGAAPANVVAVVVPPPPPAPPPLQFGEATWVKEIKTTTHNPNKVRLQDLVGDDPGNPQPWANGEPAEVEVEWRLLQTEFADPANPKGVLQGAPEDLPGGDEVITRRYEFYKYTGPLDVETGEAMADAVAADGIHGSGSVTYAGSFDPATGEAIKVTTDLSTVVVVGDFFGAQMSGFDVAPNLGLIDHIQDGEVNVSFADRTVVVAGPAPFLATVKSGSLPNGMNLDQVTGVLSGTPTAAGQFTFTVQAADTKGALESKTYVVRIAGAGGADAEPPVIRNCPQDIAVGNDPGLSGAKVSWVEPTATDNVGVTGFTSDHKPGETFAVGSTTVTYTASDAAGNMATGKFVVTVQDSEKPVISNASVSPKSLGPPNNKMVRVTVNYTTSDNCGVASTSLSARGNRRGSDAKDVRLLPNDPHHLYLRAERTGGKAVLTYVITITCTDVYKNTVTKDVTVTVPQKR
jgi:hypothetical protein